MLVMEKLGVFILVSLFILGFSFLIVLKGIGLNAAKDGPKGFAGEDTWIKNLQGVYEKHGNPEVTPWIVEEQQLALTCANETYQKAKNSGMNFSSQCLGVCDNYSIDIVHVPRIAQDDLEESQCSEFLSGKTKNFIELDKNGNLFFVMSV